VTPAVLQDLAWISYLHEVKTPDAGWFDLVVMHHTDCGSGLFADDDLRRGFAARTGLDEAELASLAVLDPAATVPGDVAKLLSYPYASPRIRVTGLAYDLKTGLASVVAPAAEARR
jgi:carbonic anhydrase